MKIAIVGIALLLSLLAFGPSGATIRAASDHPRDTTTLNGRWFLQAVLPSDTATGRIPSIIFTVKTEHFTGNTGCNSMNGTFRLAGRSLRFDSSIMLTKKMCTGYNEAAFIKSLLRADSYRFEKGVLILLYGTTELSRWTREPVHAPTMNRA